MTHYGETEFRKFKEIFANREGREMGHPNNPWKNEKLGSDKNDPNL